MRYLLLIAATVASFLAIGCDPGIGLTIDNQTDAPLCFYDYKAGGGYAESQPTPTPEFVPQPSPGPREQCTEVKPHDKVTWTVLCTGDVELTVLLTDGRAGPEIYRGTATCDRWQESDAWVKVTTQDIGFVVSDSLTKNP
jgi:hypothetical protein